ncbi:methionine--tRNA ligase [Buchnera aphidicola]|uniref:methionine--tRNA ligase n=1 Tax=Buchnera aphidicola TaxID=9 RepID=UPI0031B895BB
MKKNKRKILVTCALPYANGSLHLGHLLENIQADIWVRYHRMLKNEIYFICAGDAHGTPIMLKCKKENLKPEDFVKKNISEHKFIFNKFNIIHDNYYSTHKNEHFFFLKRFFNILKKKKLIKKKKILQYYDLDNKMFLPDRFLIGICPYCFFKNQYGDICENCSSVYSSLDLIKPRSILSNEKPVLKYSTHLFFNLPYFNFFLKKWIKTGVFQKSVLNKTKEFLKNGLKLWDISRENPYFGFKIPKYNKFFYVWFDALIGYISSFNNFCNKKNINFNEYFTLNTKTELYHFIGKDIIYFHSLFWPSILEGVSFRKPTKIFVHGYVTFNNFKMSKSRNIIITAKKWLKYYDSDSIRYYYASKLSNNIEDIEINIEDFVNTINSNIVNKIVNLASRSSKVINKKFNNTLSEVIYNYDLYNYFVKKSFNIIFHFENRNYNIIIKKIIHLSDIANKYINDEKPWKYSNNFYFNSKLHMIYSMGINLFRILITFLKPITPVLVKKSEFFLNKKLFFYNIDKPLLNHKISFFKNLYNRIYKNNIIK